MNPRNTLASAMNRTAISPLVENALQKVQRAKFVSPQWQARATEDRALPIGEGQTAPQPSLVAYMTEQLALTKKSRVLEVGTGSGYHTAILAELVSEVYTIELLPTLAAAAEERLKGMNYSNIAFRVGDGALGWKEAAPFDAILVTAASRTLSPDLITQLRAGGRMLAPLGDLEGEQTLVLVETKDSGEWRRSDLCSVWFVPLVSASL
jgi:protein-L-isoaspartate(D-aspartate) O-methyltransferase